MSVSVDAATEHFRIDTTSPQTFSHSGASSGVKGALLFIMHNTSDTDYVTAASYGGAAMTRVRREATAGAGEPGASEVWFLGSSVPQGTQNFSYTPGSTTDDIYAVGITLLAAADTESIDNDGINSTSAADPSVTLQYGGREAMAFAGLWDAESGVVDVFTENGNCTRIHSQDGVSATSFGVVFRQTTVGTSDFAIGGTCLGDELAYVALAIAEVQGGPPPITNGPALHQVRSNMRFN